MSGFFRILIVCGFLWRMYSVEGQTSYTIGVEAQYFSMANFTPSVIGNVALTYVSVSIPTATDYTTVQTYTSNLFSQNVDYLIYSYSLTASLITNNMFATKQKVVPYLVLPNMAPDPIINQNMFYIDSTDQMITDATVALLNISGATSFLYIDYPAASTASTLVSYGPFQITLTSLANTVWPQVLQDAFTKNSQSFYVCSIPLDQGSLIDSLLTEAMQKGQLNPGKVWIFNQMTSNMSMFTRFQQFSSVGASIYSFGFSPPSGVMISSTQLLAQYITRDYIRLIAGGLNNTVTKPANLTIPLLNSVVQSGDLIINSNINNVTRKISGLVLNVLKINAPTPVPTFTYNGSLIEYNINTLVRPLNYSGLTVRIGVVLSKLYFMQNSQGGYYGYSMALLRELQKLSNFNYVFVFPNDSLTGESVTWNGSIPIYSGIVSLINQNLVDMSIIPMISTNIVNAVFLSQSISNKEITMLSRPGNETAYFLLIFVPFTYNTWLAIVGIIIIMTLAFFIINKISPNRSKSGSKEEYTFFYSLLIMYSSFVTAKLKIKPTHASLQIFAFILWFSTLTLVITYAANMVPFLIKPSRSYPFAAPNDLVNMTKGFTWGFVNNSIDLEIIRNNSDMLKLYNLSMTFWPQQMFVNDTISEQAMANNLYILIQDANKNGYLNNRICNTTVFGTPIPQSSLYLVMNPSWPQRFQMKALIDQMISTGTFTLLQNKYVALGSCAKDVDNLTPTPQALTLLGSLGLFMLPVCGVGIGLLCVILGVAKEKIQRLRENMKMDKFKYGEMYMGKVHSTQRDGVWAIINDRKRPYFINSTNLHADLKKRYTPEELNIKANDEIELKYFGKDPVNGYKRFCRYTKDEEV